MRCFISFLLFLFFHVNLIAQSNIDSLESLLQNQLEDTTRVEILFTLSESYIRKETGKSVIYAEKALIVSKGLNNPSKLAKAYAMLAQAYFRDNYSVDTIIETSRKGLEIEARAKSFDTKILLLNYTALAYQRSGQLDKSFTLYQEILEIAEAKKSKIHILKAISNMAIIFNYQKEYEKCKVNFFRAYRYAKELDNEMYVSLISNNIAEVYKKMNQPDSALIYYNESLSIHKKLGNSSNISMTTSNIGDVYVRLKQYEKANTYLQDGYKLAKQENYIRELGVNLFYQTKSYFEQKKYAKAIQYGEEGLAVLGENGFATRKADYYEFLSLSYEAIGNYKKGLTYRKSFQTLNDSLFNLNKNEQMKSLEIKYKVSQKEAENQLLKSKTENAQKTIKNRTFAAIGLILALLFALSWGIFVYKSNQQRKRLNEILEHKVRKRTIELQTANENLEQANYELRTFNYIASHDIKEPIRVIGGFANLIYRGLPKESKMKFKDYFDTIKRSTTHLYTLVEDFANYTTMSKNETIEKQAVDLNELTYHVIDSLQESIQKYNGQILTSTLPTIQSSSSLLFAIFRNLIENGLKYNQSEVPTVAISYRKTTINHEISITDNGIGIDEVYHQQIFEMFKRLHNREKYGGSGIGLAIVKLSINKLNGTVVLNPNRQEGSEFIIQLPL